MNLLAPIIAILKFLFTSLLMGGETVEEVTSLGPVAAPLSPDEIENIDSDIASWGGLPDFVPEGEQRDP